MPTIRELLTTYEKKALEVNKEESAIKLLMQFATDSEGYELIMRLDEKLTLVQEKFFTDNVTKYLENNIPIQHLIGHEIFFGHKFNVNENVLIPRFETEELVAKVLDLYDEHFDGKEVNVVDVGTGCGAIGITLAIEAPEMNVTITDISSLALDVARENAEKLGANVKTIESDMLDGIISQGLRFDILVSNPPYIPQEEKVESLVLDNEPHLALFGGSDGLYFYDLILRDAKQILNTPNIIAFEHAYHHREGMAHLIEKYFPDARYETVKDMQGRDRITYLINK